MITGFAGSNRLWEWIMGLMMLGIAGTLAMPGNSLEKGPLHVLEQAGLTEGVLILAFGGIGCLRIVALVYNGRLPIPRARALGSMAAALIWAQLGSILAYGSIQSGVPSLALPIYGFLTLGELFSCYRTGYDAGQRGN
jgi:hypothetical protein